MKEGVLLVNKAAGSTSFHLVSILRRLTGIQKIGHAGTLDPFATGVMVMLIGKTFTTRSDEFLQSDKEYQATLRLGVSTDTYDLEGQVTHQNGHVPTLAEVEKELLAFQGTVDQIPPMFSAKKVNGKKLYELARKGVEVERKAVRVQMRTELLSYHYPDLILRISCSKGTYIRSIANDLGKALQCGAHLTQLVRLRSGPFQLEHCVAQEQLTNPNFDLSAYLLESL